VSSNYVLCRSHQLYQFAGIRRSPEARDQGERQPTFTTCFPRVFLWWGCGSFGGARGQGGAQSCCSCKRECPSQAASAKVPPSSPPFPPLHCATSLPTHATLVILK